MVIELPLRLSGMGYICSANGFFIGHKLETKSKKFVIKAANKHRALVKALKDVSECLETLYKEKQPIASVYFGAALAERINDALKGVR